MGRSKRAHKRSHGKPAAQQPHEHDSAVAEHAQHYVRYIVSAVLLMGVLYAIYYFPYASGTVPDRLISAYLRLHSALAGQLIGLFDASVRVTGTLLLGRFPLQIVKDCSSLDAQALLAAAVLAFPVSWKRRLIGLLLGVAVLNAVNVLRISALYFIGIHAPTRFDVAHEELMPLLLIAVAAGCFYLWAGWARGDARRLSPS